MNPSSYKWHEHEWMKSSGSWCCSINALLFCFKSISCLVISEKNQQAWGQKMPQWGHKASTWFTAALSIRHIKQNAETQSWKLEENPSAIRFLQPSAALPFPLNWRAFQGSFQWTEKHNELLAGVPGLAVGNGRSGAVLRNCRRLRR